MSAIDIENLLVEVDSDAPCGEDLEYDPEFGELERSAQTKPEQQFGDTLVLAEGPEWREVRSRALDLFSRTKDLRVAVHLTRALLSTDGLPGLRDGLALIRAMLERYWETVHPRLDPDDGSDPTMRINCLDPLSRADALPAAVRLAPLVSSRILGTFSLRDIAIASGEVAPAGDSERSPAHMADIDGAFMECEVGDLEATADAVREAIESAKGIELYLTERVGAGSALSLEALGAALAEAQRILSDRLARRGVGDASDQAPAAASGGAAGPGTASRPAAADGQIRSREDVVRMIDKACEYYRVNEPSSPVPILLRRAKRLVSKSFMEIIRDIAPDGVSQAETIEGASAGEDDYYSGGDGSGYSDDDRDRE